MNFIILFALVSKGLAAYTEEEEDIFLLPLVNSETALNCTIRCIAKCINSSKVGQMKTVIFLLEYTFVELLEPYRLLQRMSRLFKTRSLRKEMVLLYGIHLIFQKLRSRIPICAYKL